MSVNKDIEQILMKVQKPGRYVGGSLIPSSRTRKRLTLDLLFVFLMFMRWECPTWE